MSSAEHLGDISGKHADDGDIAAAFGGARPETQAIEESAFEEAAHLGEQNQNPPGISLFELIREDLRTHENDLFSQGYWAIVVHRFGNARMSIRPRLARLPFSLLYKILYKFIEWTCGISLDYATPIGRRVHLWHHGGMILSCRSIGDDVHIRQNTTFGVRRRDDHVALRPIIEDRCDIGVGAVILGPVTIGHDSQIGANAVVLKDVPPYSVAVGVPAKVVKHVTPSPHDQGERLSQAGEAEPATPSCHARECEPEAETLRPLAGEGGGEG